MSKYLAAFARLSEEFGDAFQLTEDTLLVEEIVPEEIKTQSGIIVSNSLDAYGRNADGLEVARAHYVRVLKAGPGDVAVTMPVAPGDVMNVGPNSVLWFSTVFNTVPCKPKIGLTRASEALSILKGDTYTKLGARFKELVEIKDV